MAAGPGHQLVPVAWQPAPYSFSTWLVSIRILPMPAMEQQNDGAPIINLVPDPVITNPDAILGLTALELDAPARTWILFQYHEALNDLFVHSVGQPIQLLLDWSGYDNLVAHQAFLRRRATYSSMLT